MLCVYDSDTQTEKVMFDNTNQLWFDDTYHHNKKWCERIICKDEVKVSSYFSSLSLAPAPRHLIMCFLISSSSLFKKKEWKLETREEKASLLMILMMIYEFMLKAQPCLHIKHPSFRQRKIHTTSQVKEKNETHCIRQKRGFRLW